MLKTKTKVKRTPSPRWKEYCRCNKLNCENNLCSCRKLGLACTIDCACLPTLCTNKRTTDAGDANNILTDELQTEETCEIRKNEKDLVKRLQESEESCRNLSHSLKESQDKLKLQKKTIEDLIVANEQLQVLAHKRDKECRILHNTVLELKGNIRVLCRVRPQTQKEAEQRKIFSNININDDYTIEVSKSDESKAMSSGGKTRGIKQQFSFDKIFTANASQADVFEEISPLIESAFEGYNVCVFSYGQTGSGKTYTMEGECGLQTEGIIPRTVCHIFKEMKQFELLGWEYCIKASFLEFYNDNIVDLLDSQRKMHKIKMLDDKSQDLYDSVYLKIKDIHCQEEFHECLRIAQCNRTVHAATESNERSARSHYITKLKLIRIMYTHTATSITHTDTVTSSTPTSTTTSSSSEILTGTITFVDLAGYERSKTEEMRTEKININQTLMSLEKVILALSKNQKHVPYRDSKFTYILMPSLEGNSKTIMLLNISPLDECYNETLNSLRFASNVNNCKTGNI